MTAPQPSTARLLALLVGGWLRSLQGLAALGLIVAGVYLLVGLAWALITAGVLLVVDRVTP